ncbi:hypothetical protein CDAR_511901 [Caerostris darwini]|uniref:Uncharacterized protein n=1 Tax=Caerostris darwini TaxID=1538125 RepID=A0AAV4P4H6_9ARAC|nr:hypothetical protein CDAR_511901 [Caerostris darwini]
MYGRPRTTQRLLQQPKDAHANLYINNALPPYVRFLGVRSLDFPLSYMISPREQKVSSNQYGRAQNVDLSE